MKDQDATDRLLRRHRQALGPEDRGDECPDAETIAALTSGGLPAELRAAAGAHVADCARCLAVAAALARSEPVPPPASWPWWARVRLLVPVTAAATALFLWVLVDRPLERPIPSEAQTQTAAVELSEPAAAPTAPSAPAAAEPVAPPGDVADAGAMRRRDVPPTDRAHPDASVSAKAAPPAAGEAPAGAADAARDLAELAEVSPAAPPPPEAPDATARAESFRGALPFAAEAPFEVASPGGVVRWRVARDVIERSADAGTTWQVQATGLPGPLLAGSAPAPDVCWVAGAGGTILRTTDGETWARVAFPEVAALVSVHAADAATATVTTADGRTFRTADGGQTWSLQEIPAAPF
jgi:hypothetical protein